MASKMRSGKYNAKKTIYNGILYDSKLEASFAAKLDLLRNAKGKDRVVNVSRQVVFPVTVNGFKICKYKLDFLVLKGVDTKYHYDVKGFATPVYKMKKKLVEATYGIKIIEVK